MEVEFLDAEQVRDMFLYVSDIMISREEYLTEIDNHIGDGDHGIGMAIGFRGVKETLQSREYDCVTDVFYDMGMTMLRVMGGASGVMFGTIFISGIVDMEKKRAFDTKDFADVFGRSLYALKERGKAQVGDKTMIDALEPAVKALQDGTRNKESLTDSFLRASQAAYDGMEDTKKYRARFGRAKYYGDKAIGLQDAGATSIWLIFDAMSRWINGEMIQKEYDERERI